AKDLRGRPPVSIGDIKIAVRAEGDPLRCMEHSAIRLDESAEKCSGSTVITKDFAFVGITPLFLRNDGDVQIKLSVIESVRAKHHIGGVSEAPAARRDKVVQKCPRLAIEPLD